MQKIKSKFKKRAFTMVEMMVCLVCIGLLSIGIGSFASAVKHHTAYVAEREAEMLSEYQDILNLKAYGLSFRDKTNHPEFIYEAEKKSVGETFSVHSSLTLAPDQIVTYTSADPLVVRVDDNGNCKVLYEGVTYIEVRVLTLGSDGKYHDNNEFEYFPIVAIGDDFQEELDLLRYCLYGGKHYACWFYDT